MKKFIIEQVALCPKDPEAAIELLNEMGAGEWARDIVVAKGNVFDDEDQTNVANLAFEYSMLEGAKELEILHYRVGDNWMDKVTPRISHLGMHCSAEDLMYWREFFAERGIKTAQEVLTESHSNPIIAGKRWYNYVIFDTYDILGVDVKFIVRKESRDG